MGNGQEVSRWYMGIRDGSPWPIMAMNVGVGRERREVVVIEEVKVRMYSWQFCFLRLPVSYFFCIEYVGWEDVRGYIPRRKNVV